MSEIFTKNILYVFKLQRHGLNLKSNCILICNILFKSGFQLSGLFATDSARHLRPAQVGQSGHFAKDPISSRPHHFHQLSQRRIVRKEESDCPTTTSFHFVVSSSRNPRFRWRHLPKKSESSDLELGGIWSRIFSCFRSSEENDETCIGVSSGKRGDETSCSSDKQFARSAG